MTAALDGRRGLARLERAPPADAHQCLPGARPLSSPGCPATTRAAGPEIVDTLYMVTEIAVTAGDLPAALAVGTDGAG